MILPGSWWMWSRVWICRSSGRGIGTTIVGIIHAVAVAVRDVRCRWRFAAAERDDETDVEHPVAEAIGARAAAVVRVIAVTRVGA